MENHPIPQNITGYEFKLLGNMTIRQFIYLAIGAAIGFILYFFIPIPKVVSLIIGILSFSIGAGIAFIQIDGRPMDVMMVNFIKALFAPTKYVYEKEGGNISQASFQHTATITQTTQAPPPQNIPTTPIAPMPTPMQIPTPGPVIEYQAPVVTTPPPPIQPSQDEINAKKALEEANKIIEDEKKLEEKEEELKKEIEEAKTEVNEPQTQIQTPSAANQKSPEELEKLLMETIAQKEAMEKEFLILKAKLESSQTEKFKPSSEALPLRESATAREIPKGQEASAGIPGVNDAPNLIKGIVKDPRGNPLANILVEVKDEEENPVRAFKTNGLGQFASATSVSNGKYALVFEDPKDENKFDVIEVEAKGEFIPPLEIISIDKREELRRELFN
jgi:hypothetical protein